MPPEISINAGNTNTTGTNGNGDSSRKCLFHVSTEHRISCLESHSEDQLKRCEENMKEVREKLDALEAQVWAPKVLVALIGLIGTAMAVVGSIVGTVLTAVLKAHGWI